MRIRPAELADVSAIAEIVERAYGIYIERIGLRPGPMDVDYPDGFGAGSFMWPTTTGWSG